MQLTADFYQVGTCLSQRVQGFAFLWSESLTWVMLTVISSTVAAMLEAASLWWPEAMDIWWEAVATRLAALFTAADSAKLLPPGGCCESA